MGMTNTAPSAKSLKFRLCGQPGDYCPGDDREYDVYARGEHLGVVGTEYVPTSTEGEPARGFGFRSNDGRNGMGLTRAAAVLDAYRCPNCGTAHGVDAPGPDGLVALPGGARVLPATACAMARECSR